MEKYKVEVVETLSRVVTQEANSYEEAQEIVESKYDNEDIVLDWQDLEDTQYKPYPPQNLKEYFRVTFAFDKNKKQLFVEDKRGCINYSCKDVTDLKVLLKEYFNNNVELEEVRHEQDINKKNKDYER